MSQPGPMHVRVRARCTSPNPPASARARGVHKSVPPASPARMCARARAVHLSIPPASPRACAHVRERARVAHPVGRREGRAESRARPPPQAPARPGDHTHQKNTKCRTRVGEGLEFCGGWFRKLALNTRPAWPQRLPGERPGGVHPRSPRHSEVRSPAVERSA